MSTIYETGTKFYIALFELMKAHPEVKQVKVKRIKTGKHKGNFLTETIYEDKPLMPEPNKNIKYD